MVKEKQNPQRRFKRYDIDEPVGVYVGDNYKVEKARQFSEGGMLFETIRDFIQGQQITLTFQLSDSLIIRLEGQVAYIFKPVPGKRLIGVRFTGDAPDQTKILLEYFKQR